MGAGWNALRGTGGGLRQGCTLVGLQVAGQVLFNGQRCFHRTIPLHQAAILISEELGEVPFDGIFQDAPPLGLDFHPLPQRVGVVRVHTNVAVQIEFDVIACSKLFDLSISPFLLLPELVATEGQDQ